MQKTMSDTMRLMTRRTRSGQSIIIIALGFIVLIAFVGIATDAALLFVRFSTLRRAVDAAAVAAAGQIRENTSYAQIAAAAQQYIKLHGLDPGQVLVETCETDIDNLKNTPDSKRPAGAPMGAEAHPGDFRAWLASSTLGVPNSELCRKDPAKLVRVTALIESPTTFLSVIGYKNITLAASSISQTAVMDVVLMLDSSLSMAYDTGQLITVNKKYTNQAQKNLIDTYLNDQFPGFINGWPDKAINPNESGGAGFTIGLAPYRPASIYPVDPELQDGTPDYPRSYYKRTGTGTEVPGGSVRGECRQGDPSTSRTNEDPNDPNAAYPYKESTQNLLMFANYSWGKCCNDPATLSTPEDVGSDGVYGTVGTTGVTANTNDINWFIDSRTGLIHSTTNPPKDAGGRDSQSKRMSGAADDNFADLICRPFKDVRDATRRFLLKVDFTRGDRVIMIQFDASARAVTRDGLYQSTGTTAPIFTSKSDAINALNRYVGVEVNPGGFNSTCPTIYSPANSWKPSAPHPLGVKYQISAQPYSQVEFLYENVASCPDTNTGAALQATASLLSDPRWIRRDAVWIGVLLSDGYPNRTPGVGDANNIGLSGKPYGDSPGTDYWNPNIHMIPNSSDSSILYGGPNNRSQGRFFDGVLPAALADPGFCPWRTFCDTTGGVRGGLPYDDPNGITIKGGDYETIGGTRTREANLPPYTSENGIDHYYTSYGWWKTYCSLAESNREPIWWDFYRNAVNPGPLPNDDAWHEGGLSISMRRPICSDNNPDSRHFCVDKTTGNIVPGRADLCSPSYDADDFARDRADFAALIDYTPTLKGNFIAMFSIFFPHTSTTGVKTNSVNDTVYLRENILGVKFMRYLADAGDNVIIDNPLQAWYRDQAYKGTYNREPVPSNSDVNNDHDGWNSAGVPASYKKTKDPCFDYDFREQQVFPVWDSVYKGESTDNLKYEKLAKTTCGNYYYAGDPTSIDRAFTDIASRLFTRLSR